MANADDELVALSEQTLHCTLQTSAVFGRSNADELMVLSDELPPALAAAAAASPAAAKVTAEALAAAASSLLRKSFSGTRVKLVHPRVLRRGTSLPVASSGVRTKPLAVSDASLLVLPLTSKSNVSPATS